jgi:hypothetical protein
MEFHPVSVDWISDARLDLGPITLWHVELVNGIAAVVWMRKQVKQRSQKMKKAHRSVTLWSVGEGEGDEPKRETEGRCDKAVGRWV